MATASSTVASSSSSVVVATVVGTPSTTASMTSMAPTLSSSPLSLPMNGNNVSHGGSGNGNGHSTSSGGGPSPMIRTFSSAGALPFVRTLSCDVEDSKAARLITDLQTIDPIYQSNSLTLVHSINEMMVLIVIVTICMSTLLATFESIAFNDNDIRAMSVALTVLRFGSNEQIVQAGEPSSFVAIILTGTCISLVNNDIRLPLLQGDIIGDSAFFEVPPLLISKDVLMHSPGPLVGNERFYH
jgi:hypothetical protein